MRQQFLYRAGPLGWQARQHIFEVSVGVVTIEPSALKTAHHSRTALTGSTRTGEQPVVTPDGYQSDLVLDVFVVNRQVLLISTQTQPAKVELLKSESCQRSPDSCQQSVWLIVKADARSTCRTTPTGRQLPAGIYTGAIFPRSHHV